MQYCVRDWPFSARMRRGGYWVYIFNPYKTQGQGPSQVI